MRTLLIISGIALSAATMAQAPDINMLKASAALLDKNYNKAIEILNDKEENKTATILKLYGDCYMGLHDYNTAIQYYTKANTSSTNSYCLDLAKANALLNNNSKAIQWIESYLAGSNKDSEYSIVSNEAFKNILNSIEWKNLWKKDWYSNQETERNALKSMLKNRDPKSILNELETGQAKVLPKHESYFFESQAYVLQKEWEQALNAIKKAIELQKHIAIYWETQGDIYSEAGDYALAVESYTHALEIEPNQPSVIFKRANSSLLSGNKKQANADLLVYQQIYPHKPETKYALGKLESLNDNYDQSIRYFTQLLASDRANPAYFYERGIVYLKIENYQKADEDFGMALDLNPTLRDAYLNKGKIKLYMLDNEGACFNFEKAQSYGSSEASKLFVENCNKN